MLTKNQLSELANKFLEQEELKFRLLHAKDRASFYESTYSIDENNNPMRETEGAITAVRSARDVYIDDYIPANNYQDIEKGLFELIESENLSNTVSPESDNYYLLAEKCLKAQVKVFDRIIDILSGEDNPYERKSVTKWSTATTRNKQVVVNFQLESLVRKHPNKAKKDIAEIITAKINDGKKYDTLTRDYFDDWDYYKSF
ncbi:MAG: hypothetical protein HOC17_03800 [Candidatus Ruthia sp.]|jgi:hypothetical protein|nr:hypothetical protein [Candidatus Ruthturnera sp.]